MIGRIRDPERAAQGQEAGLRGQECGKTERCSLLKTAAWVALHALHPRQRWRNARNLLLLARVLTSAPWRRLWSDLFQPLWYLDLRPDVGRERVCAAFHYALAGAWEGSDPSPAFSSTQYWSNHPDVAAAGINPLLHYIVFGKEEGRLAVPVAVQDASWRPPRGLLDEGVEYASPLVSVLIPLREGSGPSEEAAAAALEQTLEDIEVVLVGSGDAAVGLRRPGRGGMPQLVLFPQGGGAGEETLPESVRPEPAGRYVCLLNPEGRPDPIFLETALFLAEFRDLDAVIQEENRGVSVRNPDGQDASSQECRLLSVEPRLAECVFLRKHFWELAGGMTDPAEALSAVCVRSALENPEHGQLRCWAYGRGIVETPGATTAPAGRAVESDGKVRLPGDLPQVAAGQPAAGGAAAPEKNRRLAWRCLEAAGPAVVLAVPLFTVGGAELLLLSLIEEWRRRGRRVVVLITLPRPPGIPDRTDALRRHTSHVYALAEIFPGSEELRAEFVHFLLRRYHPGLLLIAGSHFLYPLLPSIRENFPEMAIVDQLFNDQYYFPANRAYARFIDCTCVPDARIARRLREEHGEDPSRVAVIPHGVSLPEPAKGAVANLVSALGRNFSGHPIVAFFGRWSKEKGPTDFVRIAAAVHGRAPQARFVMTGEGPEAEAVRAEIRGRGLEEVFCLPGFVDDVHAWIAAADVVVVPSRLDGMPLILFEAQALMKPVVASRTGSIPEVIEEGVTGFVRDPGDISGFAEAICALLADPELRRRIGAAAREYALREHRKEVMLERYFQLFESLMASKGGAAW
ncbi:MAG: hypothetical protein KatS3mg004_1087 [Bryobacteraceae bacterium]|nr:MAG: hypothetical protein KatS3mg004_1087 [Bryobacteraceae bacterium]